MKKTILLALLFLIGSPLFSFAQKLDYSKQTPAVQNKMNENKRAQLPIETGISLFIEVSVDHFKSEEKMREILQLISNEIVIRSSKFIDPGKALLELPADKTASDFKYALGKHDIPLRDVLNEYFKLSN